MHAREHPAHAPSVTDRGRRSAMLRRGRGIGRRCDEAERGEEGKDHECQHIPDLHARDFLPNIVGFG